MKYRIRVSAVLFFGLALTLLAQQPAHTVTQKRGLQVFQQRCAICHTQPMILSKFYGPALNKTTVAGRESSVRLTILDGERGLMPGFRYGLEARDIGAIIEYLKTVEPPDRPVTNWVAEH
jgi:mono/diheme cytochrome c family protein